MNESADMYQPEKHLQKESAAKWLKYLFYIHIVSVAISLISLLPIVDNWIVWISRAVALATVVCLFQLASAHKRYQKAAFFRAGMLSISLFHAFFSGRTFLILVSSVFSIIAVYQEYNGHGELVQDLDPGLSRKWKKLFTWQVLCSILVSLLTVTVSVILALLLNSGTNAPTAAATVVQVVAEGMSLALEAVYLIYLNRTIHLIQT